jgi:hypothetical protein
MLLLQLHFGSSYSKAVAACKFGGRFKVIRGWTIVADTDYGRPERKFPSLYGRKFNPNPKFLGTAEAYFVCHIG